MLICVKLYSMTVQRIDETGYLQSENGMCIFEWKVDTANLPYDRFVEYRLGKKDPV